MPMAPGSYDIYDEKETLLTLTKLIAYNPGIDTWLLKISNETNSRGIAYLNVSTIKSIKDFMKANS